MTRRLDHLARLGSRYRDPMADIDWDAADPSLPWLPREMLSLSGLPVMERLPDTTVVRLSRIEFARLCAAGLWLEGLLISRVASGGFVHASPAATRVMLQEVREEAGHGLMFLEMIRRAGMSNAELLGDTRLLTATARRLHPAGAGFWAMVYIGESITDTFSLKALRADRGEICPVARRVLEWHHKDEARHIAAAREMLAGLVARMSAIRRRAFRSSLAPLVNAFLKATLYPTRANLAAAGIERPDDIARAALACPARRQLVDRCAEPAVRTVHASMAGVRRRRTVTRLRPTGGPAISFVSSDVYRQSAYGSHHPLAIPRVATVMSLCRSLGWIDGASYRDSPEATEDELAWFHRRDYIAAVRRADTLGRGDRKSRERYGLGTMENPVFPGMYRRAATSVGGSILAARLALKGGVAYHPAGGTHHGRPDRASGFCYFNDPVFAIRTLLDGGLDKILYVDLDAHFGDGVQDAFHAEDRVFTLSVHEDGRWPFAGAIDDRAGGCARNLPVPTGFNDSELEFLLNEAILPLAERFAPAAVVMTCGADGLAGDPLSGMRLSNIALWRAVEKLVRLTGHTVVLGGGGYNPWTVARCWAGLWGRLRGFDVFQRLPADAQTVMRGLECDLLDDDDIPDDWFTNLADAPSPGPVRDAVKAMVPQVLAA